MTTAFVLSSYTFEANPESMDPPESKKTVAEVGTYAGSAVFQWGASIVGQSIVLSWPAMSTTMYNQLRTLYISTEEVTFNPQESYTYGVIVTNLDGKYYKAALNSIAYRKDVELTLNIRSSTPV